MLKLNNKNRNKNIKNVIIKKKNFFKHIFFQKEFKKGKKNFFLLDFFRGLKGLFLLRKKREIKKQTTGIN